MSDFKSDTRLISLPVVRAAKFALCTFQREEKDFSMIFCRLLSVSFGGRTKIKS
jgi:hypothetical protein